MLHFQRIFGCWMFRNLILLSKYPTIPTFGHVIWNGVMTHSFKEPRITDTTILLCSLSLSKVKAAVQKRKLPKAVTTPRDTGGSGECDGDSLKRLNYAEGLVHTTLASHWLMWGSQGFSSPPVFWLQDGYMGWLASEFFSSSVLPGVMKSSNPNSFLGKVWLHTIVPSGDWTRKASKTSSQPNKTWCF